MRQQNQKEKNRGKIREFSKYLYQRSSNMKIGEMEKFSRKLIKEDFDYAQMVSEELEKIEKEKKNSLYITIVLAKEKDKELLPNIVSDLEQSLDKKIEYDLKIDPKILGGVVLEIGNDIIDNSARRRLKKILRKS